MLSNSFVLNHGILRVFVGFGEHFSYAQIEKSTIKDLLWYLTKKVTTPLVRKIDSKDCVVDFSGLMVALLPGWTRTTVSIRQRKEANDKVLDRFSTVVLYYSLKWMKGLDWIWGEV